MQAPLAITDYETAWVHAYQAAKRRWPWWLLALLLLLVAVFAFGIGRLTALYA